MLGGGLCCVVDSVRCVRFSLGALCMRVTVARWLFWSRNVEPSSGASRHLLPEGEGKTRSKSRRASMDGTVRKLAISRDGRDAR